MTLAAAAVGIVGGALAWAGLRGTLADHQWARINHRGAGIATAGGLVVICTVVAVEAVAVLAESAGADLDADLAAPRRLVLVGVVGFGLLGLLDDVGGTGESGGLRGHIRSLARGHLTTGAVKLLGGAALGVAIAGARGPTTLARVLADGALVALSANLANLFDRAPGRTTKVALVALVGLAAATGFDDAMAPAGVAVGAALALLAAEGREHVMLGDTGANALGAALGVAALVTIAPGTRTGLTVVLVVLTVASEIVSFSRVIEATPPLRWLDRLGRRR